MRWPSLSITGWSRRSRIAPTSAEGTKVMDVLLGRGCRTPRGGDAIRLLEPGDLVESQQRRSEVVEAGQQLPPAGGVDREPHAIRRSVCGSSAPPGRRRTPRPWRRRVRAIRPRAGRARSAARRSGRSCRRRCRRSWCARRSGRPSPRSDQTAAPRELPQPKLRPPSRIGAPRNRGVVEDEPGVVGAIGAVAQGRERRAARSPDRRARVRGRQCRHRGGAAARRPPHDRERRRSDAPHVGDRRLRPPTAPRWPRPRGGCARPRLADR